MPFFQCLLPGSNQLRLEEYEIDTENEHLTLRVSSTQTSARCPLCSTATERIHSRYKRTLADLPCVSFSLSLVMQVCKFFCDNAACFRRIFTERIPEVAAPWARKTVRLVEQLQGIGLALGGAAGARLCEQVSVGVCGSTLLNQLKKLSLPSVAEPKILGVDDFAFRKGRQYGTILVDLERHQPIALLADRKAETLAEWLTQHPGVEVLTRDRSTAYKSGMDQGAPKALQVADRFHLVQNLEKILETILSSYGTQLKAIEQQQRQAAAPETVIVTPKSTATAKAQAQTHSTHQRRVEQQQKMRKLREQQWTQVAIAQELEVSERTVRRLLCLPDLPETVPRRRSLGRSILDPYKQLLLEWWNADIKQPQMLLTLLRNQGYTGSDRTLTRYISQLREAQGLPPTRVYSAKTLPKVIDSQSPPLTARRAAFLIIKRESERDSEDTELLAQLVAQHRELALAVELANEFLQLLRQQQAEAFETWLMKALKSSLKPFESFAQGLIDDYAAVKASMMTNLSNGPVEGLNNRLKMLKRQMYGRAGLELLSKRFILAQ
ncbi:MAG: ISL3 family transposase [Cyanophyceae cyanobacterium]